MHNSTRGRLAIRTKNVGLLAFHQHLGFVTAEQPVAKL